jgi:effector-binding domain-containing protein
MLRGCLTAIACATLVFLFGPLGQGYAQPSASPPAPPPAAQPAPPPAAQPDPVLPVPDAPKDNFAEEVTVEGKTVVRLKGQANWDTAFETLVDSFKSINGYMERSGLKRAGASMTVYTSTDDTGFQYEAAVPIEQPPAELPRGDIEIGKTPSGRMLKFVHRGSYDSMDTTYEAITNYLDSKSLEAKENFIEEYVTDPVTTPEDKMVINVFVPVKDGT